ncbi:unnamed protein product [Cylicocyclus nassatus]|uniref:Uncharacterized protein n=1 Tax=Cylicocyclus nassatus TaxID=53992 RepID=A0AA36GKI3_CYLNA|nr:unnamed protein product [Cylicocyclus nassatus]
MLFFCLLMILPLSSEGYDGRVTVHGDQGWKDGFIKGFKEFCEERVSMKLENLNYNISLFHLLQTFVHDYHKYTSEIHNDFKNNRVFDYYSGPLSRPTLKETAIKFAENVAYKHGPKDDKETCEVFKASKSFICEPFQVFYFPFYYVYTYCLFTK